MIIQVEDLVKDFKEERALDHVNLDLRPGKIYGIVGRNGSGKSVLMKCISGLMSPTSGRVLVDDKTVGKDMDFIYDMGLIIERPGFLGGYSAFKNLKFIASIRNDIDDEGIKKAIATVGLDPDSKKKVANFSMGMKQRLAIAQAIMENPSLIILDEPLNGLDNEGVEDIRALLLKIKKEDKLILLTSHNPEDIRILADEVYRMDKGRLTKDEDLSH